MGLCTGHTHFPNMDPYHNPHYLTQALVRKYRLMWTETLLEQLIFITPSTRSNLINPQAHINIIKATCIDHSLYRETVNPHHCAAHHWNLNETQRIKPGWNKLMTANSLHIDPTDLTSLLIFHISSTFVQQDELQSPVKRFYCYIYTNYLL